MGGHPQAADARPNPRPGIRGHVRIANRVYDTLMMRWPWSPAAHRVIGWIIRDSWGWGRVWTRTPLEACQIAKATELHRTTVWDAIRDLVGAKLIKLGADDRARVNKCVLAGRYHGVAKSLRSQTATSSNGYATVAKPLRTRSQMATHLSSNDYAASPQVSDQSSVAEPYRHLKTFEDTKDSKKIASQSPAVRDGLTAPFDLHFPASPAFSGDVAPVGRQRTVPQRMWDEDCADVLAYWRARFNANGVDCSWAGLVIRECRRIGISPRWLIDQVPADHPNPRSRIMGYLRNKYPVPELPDQSRGHCTFEAWDSRPRRCQGPEGINIIGDVLAQMAKPKSKHARSRP